TITGKGIRKAKKKEIIKDNDLKAGTKITENLLTTTKNYIANKYKKEGFLNTEVTINTTPYIDSSGVEVSKNMHISVDKGKRVKVKKITFEGNEHFTKGKLRRS